MLPLQTWAVSAFPFLHYYYLSPLSLLPHKKGWELSAPMCFPTCRKCWGIRCSVPYALFLKVSVSLPCLKQCWFKLLLYLICVCSKSLSNIIIPVLRFWCVHVWACGNWYALFSFCAFWKLDFWHCTKMALKPYRQAGISKGYRNSAIIVLWLARNQPYLYR